MKRLLTAVLGTALAGALPLCAQTSMQPGSESNIASSTAPAIDFSSSATPAASAGLQELPAAPTPAPTAKPRLHVVDWKFYSVTGALFAASVADAETLDHCENCTVLSTNARRRGVTYGVGLPIDIAATYVSYALKRKGVRWWFVPAVALTAANGYLAYHWAKQTD